LLSNARCTPRHFIACACATRADPHLDFLPRTRHLVSRRLLIDFAQRFLRLELVPHVQQLRLQLLHLSTGVTQAAAAGNVFAHLTM
jgi:hypothetical protein